MALDRATVGQQPVRMKKKPTAHGVLPNPAKGHLPLDLSPSAAVTKHEKPYWDSLKDQNKRCRLPDFRKDASSDGHGPEVGDELLRRVLADEAIS